MENIQCLDLTSCKLHRRNLFFFNSLGLELGRNFYFSILGVKRIREGSCFFSFSVFIFQIERYINSGNLLLFGVKYDVKWNWARHFLFPQKRYKSRLNFSSLFLSLFKLRHVGRTKKWEGGNIPKVLHLYLLSRKYRRKPENTDKIVKIFGKNLSYI